MGAGVCVHQVHGARVQGSIGLEGIRVEAIVGDPGDRRVGEDEGAGDCLHFATPHDVHDGHGDLGHRVGEGGSRIRQRLGGNQTRTAKLDWSQPIQQLDWHARKLE